MNIPNIPEDLKRMMNDKTLSFQQKMVSFMLFMDPKIIPDNPQKTEDEKKNYKIGEDIKNLIKKDKIKINGFDTEFNIKIETN